MRKQYLIIVNYYSRFIEIALLSDTSSETVVRRTKGVFARHGIPEVVVPANSAYKWFAEGYGFKHVTSSPYYPQGDGEAELYSSWNHQKIVGNGKRPVPCSPSTPLVFRTVTRHLNHSCPVS